MSCLDCFGFEPSECPYVLSLPDVMVGWGLAPAAGGVQPRSRVLG